MVSSVLMKDIYCICVCFSILFVRSKIFCLQYVCGTF